MHAIISSQDFFLIENKFFELFYCFQQLEKCNETKHLNKIGMRSCNASNLLLRINYSPYNLAINGEICNL